MQQYQYIVFTTPVSGRDDEFNRWSGEQHLADVLNVPGITSARRYWLRPPRVLPGGNTGLPAWTYMAIYEIQAEDPDAVLAELARRAGTHAMPINDALDQTTVATFLAHAMS
jgi:hypothetical protein